MASNAKDIQFKEPKDTVSQLNTTIRTQNDLITSLRKMLDERNAKEDEKDRILANLQAQLEYFKQKLFVSSSERCRDTLGQLDLFSEPDSEEEKRCLACGTAMVPIGHEEIHTKLRYTKAKLERIIYFAAIYGYPACKDTGDPQFIKDEGLTALIRGGYTSPSLVSHIMYEKYVDALPLYRQVKALNSLVSESAERPWRVRASPVPGII